MKRPHASDNDRERALVLDNVSLYQSGRGDAAVSAGVVPRLQPDSLSKCKQDPRAVNAQTVETVLAATVRPDRTYDPRSRPEEGHRVTQGQAWSGIARSLRYDCLIAMRTRGELSRKRSALSVSLKRFY